MSGKLVSIKESAALSDRVTHPILCYGKLLEEETLADDGVNIPVVLQNKSTVRVI